METQNYKLIPLTQNQSAIVDSEDYEWLSQWKWHTNKGYGERFIYLGRKNGRSVQKRVYMHRAILENHGFDLQGKETDHINLNRADNRIENLRVATLTENQRNKFYKTNTSGYKGVTWKNKLKKWQVAISFNKKTIYLGIFTKLKEAALTYNQAALKYHKEFARFNNV